MAAITYKCPNCGGELTFDPSSQKYKCEYCMSKFTQEELDAMAPKEGEERADNAGGSQTESASDPSGGGMPKDSQADGSESGAGKTGDAGSAMVYTCPSCGAEIVTDETTAATFCYYCHNPVVLSGRLSGEYMPNKVIPFAIDKKEATKQFMEYVGRKKFVPKAFFNKSQIEKLSGVYFPYWQYSCQVDGEADGEGTRTRVWRAGETEYTETSIYRLERRGDIALRNMTKNALKKSDKALVEGVQPYRIDEAKEFSMGYLSGFQAEKRDMEKSEFEVQMHQDAEEYSKRLLRDTMEGYSTVTVQSSHVEFRKEEWKYLLLPVWVLTYSGRNDKVYYYALNGQNGNVCGKLPVDYGKLGIVSGITAAVVFVIGLIGGYLL
ncbi:MAG: TFIIB-type zinc ribbon-containing protein [Lachnospiraceae bacterium]|nr:TFIIB-type zinc ribbon-containing protein [Lachnospiraceae bacterium]